MKTKSLTMLASLICPVIALIVAGSFCSTLHAATYPDRTITVIVPYSPGGVTDLSARALTDAMEKHLKQPVVVVNRTGGRATIGGNFMVTAKPDGYTLGYFPIATALPEVFTYFFDAPYSSKDIRPISCLAGTAMSIVVKTDSPFNSIKDIVEFARKNPGLKIGTPGKQTLPYMAMAGVAKKEGVSFVDVPMGGDAETTPALLGGHFPVGAIDYSAIKSLVDAKRLKVLAVCTEKRVDFAPTVPSMGELGYKLAYISVLGLFGQKTLPEEIVKKLDDLVGTISKQSEFRAKMRDMCIQPYYEDSATYQKSLERYKESMTAFFKEEGLDKAKK
jgi:tripartite-type tricarboxylate transporter receptor subunit TctC